jgi:ADP-ribosylglycohydrolase
MSLPSCFIALHKRFAFDVLERNKMAIYSLSDRILGALIGAATGDGMGAATEARTTEQILACFGHPVIDFETPPPDTFGAGNVPGQATDDFSSAYFLADHVIKNNGVIDAAAVGAALIDWSEHAVFFDRFAGPTTRLAIKRCKGETVSPGKGVNLDSRQATNGAAMRISPVGMFHPGNMEETIRDSITVTMVTHDNSLALAGACAISCAVSCALMPDADMYRVLQAARFGAVEGERRGRLAAKDVAGPSVVRRLDEALRISLGPGSPEEKMMMLGRRIGAGLHVAEAVPCAVGFAAANPGNPMGAIAGAVNVGYDTDTIATMTGAIVGALYGTTAFPVHYLPLLEKANGLDIRGLADKIASIAERRLKEESHGCK